MVSSYANGDFVEEHKSLEEALSFVLSAPFEDPDWPTTIWKFEDPDQLPIAAMVPIEVRGEHDGVFLFVRGSEQKRYEVRYGDKETIVNGVSQSWFGNDDDTIDLSDSEWSPEDRIELAAREGGE